MNNRVLTIIAISSAIMLLTRGAHFSGFNALPEASWMIFMVAGVLLSAWSFAWFMSLAIGIDAYAFTFGGVPDTCFSIAYSMLIPAYFSMWMAGRLSKPYFSFNLSGFAVFSASQWLVRLSASWSRAAVFTWGLGTLSQRSLNLSAVN